MAPPSQARFAAASEPQNLRRNYWAHCFDGAFFMGGMAFVNPHTVLPRMCQALGAPSWLIALAPSLLMIGFIVPGLFVARRIETLTAMRPFVFSLTVWQRMPFLVAGLGLLAVDSPNAALLLVALTPLVSGLFGGVAVNAWKEYVASTIPEAQRASLWGLRFALGAIIGFAAGKIVSQVLGRYPGAFGYGVLHVIAALFLLGSFISLSLTHEGPRDAPLTRRAPRPLLESFSELPRLVRSSASVRAYALSRLGFHGFLIMAPFLGIHALEVLHKPDAFLGELLVANTAGSLAGFVLGGYSGDRHGGKVSMLLGHLGFIVLCGWAPLANSEREFLSLFFLFGFSLSIATVAAATLDLEIAPAERRPTYQALLGIFALGGVLLATLAGAVIRSFTHSFTALALPAGAVLLASLGAVLAIQEPRRRLLLGHR